MTSLEELAAGDTPNRVRLQLAHDESAPGQARSAARQALLGWRLPGLVDSVVLAVSELVTNAVRYGRPPVAMGLHRRGRQVQLAVHDGNPAEPHSDRSQTSPHAESGRGISIVNALADQVAVEQVPDDGKVIHAVFSVPPPQLP